MGSSEIVMGRWAAGVHLSKLIRALHKETVERVVITVHGSPVAELRLPGKPLQKLTYPKRGYMMPGAGRRRPKKVAKRRRR